MLDALWSNPHHDGSESYVPDPTPTLGGKVELFLRLPRVLVHAARAPHEPVCLPVAVVGAALEGMAGSGDLHAGRDGSVTLPAGGPAFGMWRLAGVAG